MPIDQNEQLKTWASQRDSILSEIAVLNIEKERLIIINKDLANSNTDISIKIIESEGRMAELDKKEIEYQHIVSSEIAELQKNKTLVEATVTGLEKDVFNLSARKEDLISTINTLQVLHDQVYKRTGVLDQVIDRVTRVNADNINDVNILVSGLKISLQELIDLNKKTVSDTNLMIVELPKIFFELRKESLTRKKI